VSAPSVIANGPEAEGAEGVAIATSHVSKRVRDGASSLTVLDDVSLTVRRGERVALLGPSGSGKSTLLNIIAGIDRPTSGRVTVEGRDVLGMSESERTAWRTRTIGYVFQFHNLMPVLTAYENVELPLLLLPLSRKERHDHVLAALEAVGLLDRQRHFPRQLSGGQGQRVAIARAIVTDVRALLADEPTGNLDAESAKEVMVLLKRLNQEYHKTILTVTHDAHAAAYADRALRLEKGQLAAASAAVPATA
jgi:putative ABC transport system ATP-binding protein